MTVRHDRAAEFVEVVTGLWESWGGDAFLHDNVSGHFFDPPGRGHRPVIATPPHIVDTTQEWVEVEAACRFSIIPSHLPRSIEDFVELAVLEMQSHLMFRKQYARTTLRRELAMTEEYTRTLMGPPTAGLNSVKLGDVTVNVPISMMDHCEMVVGGNPALANAETGKIFAEYIGDVASRLVEHLKTAPIRDPSPGIPRSAPPTGGPR